MDAYQRECLDEHLIRVYLRPFAVEKKHRNPALRIFELLALGNRGYRQSGSPDYHVCSAARLINILRG